MESKGDGDVLVGHGPGLVHRFVNFAFKVRLRRGRDASLCLGCRLLGRPISLKDENINLRVPFFVAAGRFRFVRPSIFIRFPQCFLLLLAVLSTRVF